MTRPEWSALKAEGQIGAESPIGAVARPWRNFLRLVAHVERLEAVKDASTAVLDFILGMDLTLNLDGLGKPHAEIVTAVRALKAALAATKEPDRG